MATRVIYNQHPTVVKHTGDKQFTARIEAMRRDTPELSFTIMRVLRHDKGATHVVIRTKDEDELLVLVLSELSGRHQICSIISQSHPRYHNCGSKGKNEFVLLFPVDSHDQRAYKKLLRGIRKEIGQ